MSDTNPTATDPTTGEEVELPIDDFHDPDAAQHPDQTADKPAGASE